MPLLGFWTTQGFPHQPPLLEPQGPGHQEEKLRWGKSSTPHSVFFQKQLFPLGLDITPEQSCFSRKFLSMWRIFLKFIFYFFPLGVWVFGFFRGVFFRGGCLGFFGWTLRRYFFLLVGYFCKLKLNSLPQKNLSHLLPCRKKKVFPSIIKTQRWPWCLIRPLYPLRFFSHSWHGEWSGSDTFISFSMRVSRERMMAITPVQGWASAGRAPRALLWLCSPLMCSGKLWISGMQCAVSLFHLAWLLQLLVMLLPLPQRCGLYKEKTGEEKEESECK